MRKIEQCGLWLLAAALLLGVIGLSGCGKKPARPDAAIDLSERFSLVDPGSLKKLERQKDIIRKGQRRESIILIAPAVIRASMHGISGRATLQFLATPVFDVGDGIQMNLFVVRAGTKVPVGGRYFDPGRKAEDRNWIPIAIPLEVQPGDQMEIEVSPGPQGDFTADWLALSSTRLVVR